MGLENSCCAHRCGRGSKSDENNKKPNKADNDGGVQQVDDRVNDGNDGNDENDGNVGNVPNGSGQLSNDENSGVRNSQSSHDSQNAQNTQNGTNTGTSGTSRTVSNGVNDESGGSSGPRNVNSQVNPVVEQPAIPPLGSRAAPFSKSATAKPARMPTTAELEAQLDKAYKNSFGDTNAVIDPRTGLASIPFNGPIVGGGVHSDLEQLAKLWEEERLARTAKKLDNGENTKHAHWAVDSIQQPKDLASQPTPPTQQPIQPKPLNGILRNGGEDTPKDKPNTVSPPGQQLEGPKSEQHENGGNPPQDAQSQNSDQNSDQTVVQNVNEKPDQNQKEETTASQHDGSNHPTPPATDLHSDSRRNSTVSSGSGREIIDDQISNIYRQGKSLPPA